MFSTALLPLLLASPQPLAEPLQPTPLIQDEEPVEGWTGSLAAGGMIRSGNNKTRTANASVDAGWRRDNNRVTLVGLWSYQDDNRVVTQRKLYGSAKYDRFLSENTFAYGQTLGDSDKEAGLDLRLTLGGGLGRQFVDDETWKFSAEGGLSGVSEDFQTSGKNEYLAARLAYSAAYNHSETWAFEQDAQAYPSLENADDIYARLDTRAKLTLTQNMFAQLQWVMDYDNTPDTGKERIDHLFALSVGWSF